MKIRTCPFHSKVFRYERTSEMHLTLHLSGVRALQVYNSLCMAFPRRFVLPLNVTDETPTGQNLNTRPFSTATCVKTGRNQVSRTLGTRLVGNSRTEEE